MFTKIIFIWDWNSIHLKKWISFFSKNFDIILISDTLLNNKSIQFWKKIWIEYYDYNIKWNLFFRGLNLFRKFFYYNYIIYTNRNNSVINWHYISLNFILSFPSALLIKKRIATLWWSDFNLASWIQKIILKSAFKFSHFITSDTQEILNKTNHFYNIDKKKLVYINHWVDSNIFNEKKSLNKEKNKLVIFSPRWLSSFYNHHILFENIDLLISKFWKNIKLVFIDYNTDEKYKKKLIKIKDKYKDNIDILPSLTQKQLWEQYKNCDIVISIPKDDGLAVTLIEALFSLKPVIWINKKDYKSILNKDLIIQNYDINEIIEKIEFYLKNKNKIDKEIKTIKNKNFDKFDYYKNMKKMERLYLK